MPKKSKKMPTAAMKKAEKHSDILGAGAKKRKHLHGQEKVGVVMHELSMASYIQVVVQKLSPEPKLSQ